MEKTIEALKYPIGRFNLPAEVSAEEIRLAIGRIATLPSKIAAALEGLSDTQLEQPYRPGGWTIRQVVHHLADSHMNAFIRFKLALTEDAPVIKPYAEALWAAQDDYHLAPEISLAIIDPLHKRWINLMESMKDADWERTFIHPQYNRVQKLCQTVMLYAWHGEHHLGHIRNAKSI
jgi:uncharacterized damage-inducible protein DinB